MISNKNLRLLTVLNNWCVEAKSTQKYCFLYKICNFKTLERADDG